MNAPTRSLLPHEDERHLLGALLLGGNAALAEVGATGLTPEDFGGEGSARLYQLLREMDARGEPIDSYTVLTRIHALGAEPFGGLAHLSSLADFCPSSELAAHYAREIQGYAARRRLRAAAAELAAAALDFSRPLSEVVADAERALGNVAGSTAPDAWLTGADLAKQVWDAYQAGQQARASGSPLGLPWGIDAVDRVYPAGMQPGWLVIIGGRPGMGKTSLLLEVVRSALERGQAAAVFSLEMSGCELGQKAACLQANIPTTGLLTAELDAPQESALVGALDRLSTWRLWIDQRPAQTLEVIASKARRLAARCQREGTPLALIGVDYLQLLRAPGTSSEERIAEISRGLKALAKELGLPIIALAQLNREVEGRADKRPTKADLRSSGQIEQDADVIAYPYRPHAAGDDHYGPEEAELLIRKYRSGEEAIIPLSWDGSTQRFADPRNVRSLSPAPSTPPNRRPHAYR